MTSKTKFYLLSVCINRKYLIWRYQDRTIWLLCRNEQHLHSDIDILVDFASTEETFDNFMNLYSYLEDLFADKKVEVLTVNGLSPYIGRHILKEVNYV